MAKHSIQYWLRVTMISIMAILLLMGTKAVALPFVVSFVLTLILLPLVNIMQDTLQKRFGLTWLPRSIAILPAFLLVALLLYLATILVLTPFLTEFTRLVANFPSIMSQVYGLTKLIPTGPGETGLPPQIEAVVGMAITRIGNYGVELAQQGITAVFSFAGMLLELLLVPIITFYLLKDGRQLKRSIINVFPEPTTKHLYDAFNQIHQTVGGYLRGQLVLATNMFVIILIVAFAYDLPYPFVLALLAFIAEWMPIIGPFISAGPAIILAALIGGTLAVKVAITYFIILMIDSQIIMPKVMGHIIKLHPVVIISVIFIGGSLYGVIGMMTAVPVTAIIQIIMEKLWYFNKFYKEEQ
ncbi:AI-2E family transporter [Veillonella sp.]|jgi:predicted PurR-regulated permease PerM|uniref:AI-2E family transporter n=1 Tax=Veillonella sp. TaxID=1926307 RepID=UPI001B4657EE|nr:AI-2E family transporter [Veillonella sp.]MBP9551240.1 AI-2E family transporter [Veillonella sp.]